MAAIRMILVGSVMWALLINTAMVTGSALDTGEDGLTYGSRITAMNAPKRLLLSYTETVKYIRRQKTISIKLSN